ncbi:MAG: peptidase S24 [Polaribacter sp.]|nr:peptidase S24 [Polaribacter sp.]
MKFGEAQLIQKTEKNYRVKNPNQTGFSSPATHYTEPRIDLNDVLVNNPSATFFVRVRDDSFAQFQIDKNDVLIIDKSLHPKQNQLILVFKDGESDIVRVDENLKDETQLWGVITYIIKAVS